MFVVPTELAEMGVDAVVVGILGTEAYAVDIVWGQWQTGANLNGYRVRHTGTRWRGYTRTTNGWRRAAGATVVGPGMDNGTAIVGSGMGRGTTVVGPRSRTGTSAVAGLVAVAASVGFTTIVVRSVLCRGGPGGRISLAEWRTRSVDAVVLAFIETALPALVVAVYLWGLRIDYRRGGSAV